MLLASNILLLLQECICQRKRTECIETYSSTDESSVYDKGDLSNHRNK